MDSFESLFPTHFQTQAKGTIKSVPEDFQVTEISPEMSFTGEGEHLWLWVRKINNNTDWVAQCLARACRISHRQVGYAGLKDRHALTWQWFSIQLPKESSIEHIQAALPEEIQIEESHWHNKKCKTGYLSGNQFKLRIRDIQGEKSVIEKHIQYVIKDGVPNYFGPQRFGNQMANINKAKDLFSGQFKTRNKKLKSLLVSTARSHIFNNIIKQRIESQCWQQSITGDVMILNGSKAWFPASEESPEQLTNRLQSGDIHISAAMWGEDEVQSTGSCADIEIQQSQMFPEYKQGFEQFRVKQERRAIRLLPQNMSFKWIENGDSEDLILSFELPSGCYATSVLREIIQTK